MKTLSDARGVGTAGLLGRALHPVVLQIKTRAFSVAGSAWSGCSGFPRACEFCFALFSALLIRLIYLHSVLRQLSLDGLAACGDEGVL